MEAKRTVEVFLNGEARMVPNWVSDVESFRTALRLKTEPGSDVAYANTPTVIIDPWDGHVFVDGDKYITVDATSISDDSCESEDVKPWQSDPDAWKPKGWSDKSDDTED